MRRYAQTALLLLVGGMLLKLAFTGSYARYVSDAHLPLLILTGLGLVVIAGVTLWWDIRTLGLPGDDDATAPMTLGGLFGTVTLSAPDRTGSQPAARAEPVAKGGTDGDAPRPDRTAAEPAPAASSVTDFRERAVAAGLAAAAHEGLDAPPADDAVSDGSAAAANEPTARFDSLGAPAPTAREPAPVEVAPSDPFDDAAGSGRMAGSPIVAGTRAGWALLVAALAILVISPPALGTDPAARFGTVSPADAGTAALPDGDPVTLSLVDYVAYASAGGQPLRGRRVRLVGFVLAGPHGEPYLARLVMGCCAAGTLPVKVGLTGDLPGVLTPGTWLAVTGTYAERVDRDPVNGAAIPYMSVVELSDLEPPTDLYEH